MQKRSLCLILTFLSAGPALAETCQKKMPSSWDDIKLVSEGKAPLEIRDGKKVDYVQVDKDEKSGKEVVNSYFYNSRTKKFDRGHPIPVSSTGEFPLTSWQIRLTEGGCLRPIGMHQAFLDPANSVNSCAPAKQGEIFSIRFKADGWTKSAMSAKSSGLEPTEKGSNHRTNGKGLVCVIKDAGGKEWISYVRDVGSPVVRFLPFNEVEVKDPDGKVFVPNFSAKTGAAGSPPAPATATQNSGKGT